MTGRQNLMSAGPLIWKKRLAAHNDGSGAKATRGRQWRLVHSEVFKTRSAAMSREYELKNNRRERRRLLDGNEH